jgi:hypothetical protein
MTLFQALRDETFRTEIGSAALSDLAVENLSLSTPDISTAVRRSIIERRAAAGSPVVGSLPTGNRLRMDEVALPGTVTTVVRSRAA